MKNKLRTCTLCKPHKRGMTPRWKNRDLFRLREFERDRLTLVRRDRAYNGEG